MENVFNEGKNEDIVQVVDLDVLKKYFYVEDEIRNADMTSLGTLLLLEQAVSSQSNETPESSDDDTYFQRLSLAYEGLSSIPQIILEQVAPYVKILDISYNNLQNLEFLADFKQLTSLICDRNNFSTSTSLPYIPKLELLWMNHCKISDLYTWTKKLQFSFPNLKYLSLMGNPVCPFYHSTGNFYEYIHYRWFLISLFPNLIHLDDTPVTEHDRMMAQKEYQTPLLDRWISKTHRSLPSYLRSISGKVSELVNPPPPGPLFHTNSRKNVMI